MNTQDDLSPSGASFEDAIPIDAHNSAEGVPKEYEWLEKQFGRRNQDWQLLSQALTHHEDRSFDVMHIRLADGTERQIHFDITEFFGKDFDLDGLLSGSGEDT